MECTLAIHSTKTYADVGVQTLTSATMGLDQLSEIIKEKIHLSKLSNVDRPVVPVETVDISKKDEILHIEARKSNLPYNRPSKFSSHVTVQEGNSRTISLPECILAEALGGRVHSTFKLPVDVSSRSVSMPSTYKDFSRFASQPVDQNVTLQTSPSFSIDGAEYARIHVSPRTPDLPHTPSPSSSFDSVEIIQNSFKLPDKFLKIEDMPRNIRSDNDGWLTWANSPPRPIPALHGPASLPYARCPSGAEGIIIEEPSNVPRLIWGLGGITEDVSAMSPPPQPPPVATTRITNMRNDAKFENSYAGSEFELPQVNLQASRKNAILDNQSGRERDYTNFWTYHTAATKCPNSASDIGMYEHVPSANAERLLEFAFRANNAGIDTRFGDSAGKNLSLLSASERNNATKSLSSADSKTSYQTKQDTKTMPELDAYSREQRSFAAMLRANATPFVPGYQGIASKVPILSKSRQTVEESSNHKDTFKSLCTDISWYLQQQAQQHLLPTPPNSASPRWSSSLSPILNVSVSPNTGKALMVHSSPGSEMLEYSSNGIQKLDELSRELHHLMYNESSIHEKALRTYGSSNSQVSTFKAASPVTSPLRTLTRTSNVYLPIHLKDLVPNPTFNGVVLGPASIPQFTDPTYMVSKHLNTYGVPFIDSYPSPSSTVESPVNSPERQFSHPYPRSSSFNRTLERRLSVVPEEEMNTSGNSLNEKTANQTMSVKVKHSRVCRNSDHRNYKDGTAKQIKQSKFNAPVSSVTDEKKDSVDKENWTRKKRTRSRN